jgi:hypothetical protein
LLMMQLVGRTACCFLAPGGKSMFATRLTPPLLQGILQKCSR